VGSGYIYYVSLKGVTGSGNLDIAAVAARHAADSREVGMPVGVGFGIRDAVSAGASPGSPMPWSIGSRIIEEIEKSPAETACANVRPSCGRWSRTFAGRR
jgi:tryptophan synthase alpha chain